MTSIYSGLLFLRPFTVTGQWVSLSSAWSPIFFHLWMVLGKHNASVLITQGHLPGGRPSVGQIRKLPTTLTFLKVTGIFQRHI